MIPSKSPLPREIPDVKFTPHALEDYQYWQKEDPAVARRIARLIAAIRQDPFHGIGHPEPLKHQLSGYWSAANYKGTSPRLRLQERQGGGHPVSLPLLIVVT